MKKYSIKSLSLLLVLLLLPTSAARVSLAQETSGDKEKPAVNETGGARTRRSNSGRRGRQQQKGKGTQQQGTAADSGAQQAQPDAVTVVNKGQTDYLSGETSVVVNPKQPTVIRIALAQNATCVVEFPVSDFIYYTYEGNPGLVAIFASETKETDHFITLMPGTGFVAPPPGGKGPVATITLQMQSGLVIPLIIIPVADPMYNAHRVVLNYNRDEVVAARRAAGLAVNLDGKDKSPPKPNAAATRVGKPGGDGEANDGTERSLQLVADVDGPKPDGKKPKKGSKPVDPASLASKTLLSSVKSSNKVFTKWSPSAHGMSVSVAPAVDVDDRSQMIVVAVRNDTSEQIRLVPGNPEVFVQWFDEKGTPINITDIKKLHVETTSVGGRIPIGQIVYYAIVFETPVLGALQKVRVSVAQITASDQPVSADLASGTR